MALGSFDRQARDRSPFNPDLVLPPISEIVFIEETFIPPIKTTPPCVMINAFLTYNNRKLNSPLDYPAI
jgi:hypothetical protein